MKILIADDNYQKQEELKKFVEDKFPYADIEQQFAFNSTFKALNSNDYDFVFLDMTMPSFEQSKGDITDQTLRTLAGKDIVTNLSYRNIFVKIIIVTQFEVFGRHDQITPIDSIFNELKEKHPKMILGCVLFDFQSDSWKIDLHKLIESNQC